MSARLKKLGSRIYSPSEGILTLWCKELLFPPWTLTIAWRLAGVLVDLVIVRPDEFSGSETSALSENSARNFINLIRNIFEIDIDRSMCVREVGKLAIAFESQVVKVSRSILQNEAIERKAKEKENDIGWLIEVDSSFSFFPSVCFKKKGRELIYSAWKKEMWPIKERRHDWSYSLERVNISRGSYKDLWCNCEDKTGCDRRLQIPDLLLSLSLYIYIYLFAEEIFLGRWILLRGNRVY